jgi:hypothetical protein
MALTGTAFADITTIGGGNNQTANVHNKIS